MKFSFYTLLLTLFFNSLQAQQFSVSGSIVEQESGDTLTGANIIVENSDEKAIAGVAADVNGKFNIAGLSPGNYQLLITFIGYRIKKIPLEISTANIELGGIELEQDAQLLEAAEVKALLQRVIVKTDTLQFNADAYTTTANATAEELLAKMPGMQVKNGEVKAQGEQVSRVLVDGEEFFTGDVKLALKNLPASIIDKVEVIDGKTEQSKFSGIDDGEIIKTINLITKPGKNKGYFGRAYMGTGTEKRYIGGGNINYFNEKERISLLLLSNNINQQNFSFSELADLNGGSTVNGSGGQRYFTISSMGPSYGDMFVTESGGITTTNALGLNYSNNWNNKFKLSGSYFVNHNKSEAISNLNRYYFTTDEQYYRSNIFSSTTSTNHRLSLRSEYSFSKNTSILFRPSLRVIQSRGENINTASTGNAFEGNQTTGISTLQSDLGNYYLSGDLFLRHKFSKERRTISLNIEAGHGKDNGSSILLFQNNFFQNDSIYFHNQQNRLNSTSTNIEFDLQYTEPIGEKSTLSFEYEPEIQKDVTNQKAFVQDSISDKYEEIIPELSTEFNTVYFKHTGGMGYSFRNKATYVSARINMEYAELISEQNYPQGDYIRRHFTNLLPMLNFRHQFEKKGRINFYYRSDTYAPEASGLMSNINNTNPLQLSTGNPQLRQTYFHYLRSSYDLSFKDNTQHLYIRAGAQFSEDYVSQAVWIADTDSTLIDGFVLARGAQFTKPVNLSGYYNLSLSSGYGFPLEKLKSNLDLSMSLSYRKTPSLINNMENFNINRSAGISLRYNSNWSENFDLNFSYRGSYNMVENLLQSVRNDNFYNHSLELNMDWVFWGGFVIRNSIRHTFYAGLSNRVSPFYTLWNSSLGYKFLRKDAAEISISIFDLLEENINVSRRIEAAYLEDKEENVLTRYFLLKFTYNFKDFEGKPQD